MRNPGVCTAACLLTGKPAWGRTRATGGANTRSRRGPHVGLTAAAAYTQPGVHPWMRETPQRMSLSFKQTGGQGAKGASQPHARHQHYDPPLHAVPGAVTLQRQEVDGVIQGGKWGALAGCSHYPVRNGHLGWQCLEGGPWEATGSEGAARARQGRERPLHTHAGRGWPSATWKGTPPQPAHCAVPTPTSPDRTKRDVCSG